MQEKKRLYFVIKFWGVLYNLFPDSQCMMTNVNMIKCALDLYTQRNLDIMNLYITKSLVYRTIFFTPVIAKYMKKEPQYNETSV